MFSIEKYCGNVMSHLITSPHCEGFFHLISKKEASNFGILNLCAYTVEYKLFIILFVADFEVFSIKWKLHNSDGAKKKSATKSIICDLYSAVYAYKFNMPIRCNYC